MPVPGILWDAGLSCISLPPLARSRAGSHGFTSLWIDVMADTISDFATDQGMRSSLRIDRDQQSLTHKVRDVLRKAILSGEFKPGQRLVERTLCDLIGVSRTAIREALRALEAEGLVVNAPNFGPIVAIISYEQAKQIYAVRFVLELKAVDIFLENITDEKLTALGRALVGMEKSNEAGDLERVNEYKAEFYDILISRCGNEIIGQLLRQLYGKMAILRHMTMAQSNRTSDAIREMRGIYDALYAKDAKATKEASVRHLNAAAAVALTALSGSSKDA